MVLALWLGSLSLAACRMPEAAEAPVEPAVQVEAEPTVAAEPPAAEVQAEPPAAEEQVAEEPPAEETTTEAAAPEPVDWTRHAFVAGDFYLLGNPDAPVLIIDVSDFL